jgi:hypothetical protein
MTCATAARTSHNYGSLACSPHTHRHARVAVYRGAEGAIYGESTQERCPSSFPMLPE